MDQLAWVIVREIKNHKYPTLSPYSQWAVEVLIKYKFGSGGKPMTLADISVIAEHYSLSITEIELLYDMSGYYFSRISVYTTDKNKIPLSINNSDYAEKQMMNMAVER